MILPYIAKALGGSVVGGRVMAPGPGHSPHDRSLAVFLDSNAPDGFRVHSFAGDDWRTCREYVRCKLGIKGTTRGRGGYRSEPLYTPSFSAPIANATRIASALAIFAEAQEINGSPAMRYLAKRGIDSDSLPADLHEVLRWHPTCPWDQGRYGCMVALMTDAVTGRPSAIHRTAISPKGEKMGKKMLGLAGGSVIRLWADEAVTTGLVLAEGIETALAAATRIDHRGTHLFPVWASGCAVGMAKFPVLAGIECLTLLVDHDQSGAGQHAALECSGRWTAAGCEVVRLVPDGVGKDFADIGGRAA